MILVVAEALGGSGGIQRSTLEVCAGLSERGHAISLVYGQGGSFSEDWSRVARSRLEIGSTLLPRRQPVRSARRVHRAVRFATAAATKVVYTHSNRQLELGFFIARRLGVRHVHHARTRPPSGRRLRWMARGLSSLIAVSPSTLDEWRGAGACPERAAVVPNGVDLRRFTVRQESDRSALRRELGLDEEVAVVGYFGRIDPMKGLDDLLEAWGTIRRPDRRLLVVGGATQLERSRAYLPSFQAQVAAEDVIWIDHVDDVAPYMKGCDAIAVPSHYEPFGRVAIEGLACGVPVVATAVGGLESILAGALAAHLVPAHDPATLAQALDRALAGAVDPAALRARAERFSLDECVSRVEQVLAER
jgi:glycosyltransferase involved in cell wall biosynthesis